MTAKDRITFVHGDITTLAVERSSTRPPTRCSAAGAWTVPFTGPPDLGCWPSAIGGCPTGEVRVTGGYNLPAKHVIHTVGPVWHGGGANEERPAIGPLWRPPPGAAHHRIPLHQHRALRLKDARPIAHPGNVCFVTFSDRDHSIYESELQRIA